MRRLTGKYNDGYYDGYYTTGEMSSVIAYYDEKKFTNAAIEKLGELEDIEEELGIDLITLFKALKNGVYYKVDNEILFEDDLSLHNGIYNGDRYLQGDAIYLFKNYGKKWALTKEELE